MQFIQNESWSNMHPQSWPSTAIRRVLLHQAIQSFETHCVTLQPMSLDRQDSRRQYVLSRYILEATCEMRWNSEFYAQHASSSFVVGALKPLNCHASVVLSADVWLLVFCFFRGCDLKKHRTNKERDKFKHGILVRSFLEQVDAESSVPIFRKPPMVFNGARDAKLIRFAKCDDMKTLLIVHSITSIYCHENKWIATNAQQTSACLDHSHILSPPQGTR